MGGPSEVIQKLKPVKMRVIFRYFRGLQGGGIRIQFSFSAR